MSNNNQTTKELYNRLYSSLRRKVGFIGYDVNSLDILRKANKSLSKGILWGVCKDVSSVCSNKKYNYCKPKPVSSVVCPITLNDYMRQQKLFKFTGRLPK